MKRKIVLILLMCLSFSMSGCIGGSKTDGQETSVKDTETVERNEEDSSPMTPTLQIPGIVENGTAVDEDGVLIYVPNETITKNAGQELYLLSDRLVSVTYSYDTETKITSRIFHTISLDTGEVLNTASIPNVSDACIQICDDQIILIKSSAGEIRVLDKNLQQKETYMVMACDQVFVNTSVTEAYCFMNDTGIHVYDLANGQEKEIYLADTCNIYVSVMNENNVSMSYVNKAEELTYNAGLNLETGELEKLELDAAFSMIEYSFGNWLADISDRSKNYLLGSQKGLFQLEITEDGSFVNLLGGVPHVMMRSYIDGGTQRITIYDMDGTFLSSITLASDWIGPMTGPIWCEAAGGYFFTIMDENYEEQLYFWDLSVKMSGENLQLLDYEQEEALGGEALPQAYYDKAAALSEKYGITIKIADQCRTDFETRTVEQEFDTSVIDTGFAVLEETLGSFPDNIFKQLYYGSIRQLEINLMGEIVDHEPIPGHVPIGFVQPEDRVNVMVLNINGSSEQLKSLIYHETAHMIDQKMEFHADIAGDSAIYSVEKWNALNPGDFVYTESYDQTDSMFWDHTSYFVDMYSTTYASEDRARIFEYAAMHNTIYFNTNGMAGCYEKLVYFSECIRDTFDTTGWPEETIWEYSITHANDSLNG